MKVNLFRTGGFAGLTTGWELRVDDQDDPDYWRELVEACPWDEPDRRDPQGNDRFVYEFRAGQHRAMLGETYVEGPWRELADKVREDGQRIPAREIVR